MAGSFEFFRKYQRSLLVFVAILAMLAFFVLPPFLQMGSSFSGNDPVVATFSGGEIRASQMESRLAMRSVVNRFLVESAQAAGRDPSRLPLFPESEEAVVRTILVAKEAEQAGLVISDQAINNFLSEWTNDLVGTQEFDAILSRLRVGQMQITQEQIFEALRGELVARNMLILFQTGFSGDPSGWRWDYFRRLEQNAVAEIFPVPVELFSAQVRTPSERELETFFERYRNTLPEPSSSDPGFREPHRMKCEYLVASRETFEKAAAGEITQEQISEYYEKNKTTMFRAKPKAPDLSDEPPVNSPETKSSESTTSEPVSEPATSQSQDSDAETKSVDPVSEEKPSDKNSSSTQPRLKDNSATEFVRAGQFIPVSMRSKLVDEVKEENKEPEKNVPETVSTAEKADSKILEESPATNSAPIDASPDPEQFETLESVEDRIREQLARERANARIDEIFTAVAVDLNGYSEDFALWQARPDQGLPEPIRLDLKRIAEVQGLQAGESDRIAPGEAFAIEGIGPSFEFVPDASSRFGMRQQRWLDSMYGSGSVVRRPVTTRDSLGNRYLSWKTEDQPEFAPSFAESRTAVERAWRLVEARGLARANAESVKNAILKENVSLETYAAALPSSKPKGELEVVTKEDGLEDQQKVVQVGPLTWMNQGNAPMGTPPEISNVPGLTLVGQDFMQMLFGLKKDGCGIEFNEPKTICYVAKIISFEPTVEELRSRFFDQRADQQRLAMLAQDTFSGAFGDWLEGLEKRYSLQWRRQPHIPGR
ncbi:MAG: hypothetical protein DWH94_02945 [Planctomycetota bacterium]|nr:MAG: hypothetical protein DWH94_02945 [Planctomycetota bacterium]